MFSKKEIELAPKVYEALKKLGYKWIPEEGEWGLTDYGEAVLICRNVDEKTKENCPFLATGTYGVTACIGPGYHEVGIPILHWEKIEEMLEGTGYGVWVFDIRIKEKRRFLCHIWRKGKSKDELLVSVDSKCKTRQEAVMEAVLKLGEEK